MNPHVSAVLIAAGGILLFIIWIAYENRKRKKITLRKIRRVYGQPSEREYEFGEIERISHYFRRRADKGFVIDDVTWNDLDMDGIYRLVNQTMSSPGEDVLYDMMRRPLFSEEEVKSRDELVNFFATHEREREHMQLLLSKIGKTKLSSLSDTVLELSDAPKVSLTVHVFMLILLLVSIFVVFPLSPVYGFLAVMVLSISNVVIYYAGRDRKLVEVYLDCFSSLLRMLDTAREMETVEWRAVKKQMDAIRDGKNALAGIKRKAFFLTGKNSGGDDIMQLMMDYIRMVFHVDILTYNLVLKDVQRKTDKIMELIDNLGELDAAISIASFREILPLKCRPRFVPYEKGTLHVKVEDLYHPLLREAVANSMDAEGGTLVTGSNASGKSTFLKNMALNSILAQTLVTCTCADYEAPFLKVMTSMALRDDLSGGESYFIVEIKSLKRIMEESKKEEPLLCIIDEVLRGTNTIERIAASSRILKSLEKDWVLPFAATHDVELSYILEGIYKNYHFEEEVKDGQVVFNYLLKNGRATTRNAIRLLDILGYDKKLVEDAQEAAVSFERTGVWKAFGEK